MNTLTALAAPVSLARAQPRLFTWRRFAGTAGPGMLIAVGYIDPGNWATDLGGGARYGYALLSMVFVANLIAMVVQALCVRLAIATGRSLAEYSREAYARPVVVMLWLSAELAMVMTDLAELVGGAIALKLLFGIGLVPGVVLTSTGTLLLLTLSRSDWRWLRNLVGGLVVIVAASFASLLWLAQPAWTDVALGLIPTPQLVADPGMLLLALGIVGATVMPHNLYLHSGLLASAGRALDRTAKANENKARAIAANVRDSNTSLGFALLINAAILIAAGAVFHSRGLTDVADLGAASQLLDPVLGSQVAAFLFAVGLLAAGQSSTITGTLAGQMVMEGFLHIRLSAPVRRLVTRLAALGPALAYFLVMGEGDTSRLLILSQVVLSLQLPFAMIPLLSFVGQRKIMGEFALGRRARLGCWGLALFVVLLNVALIVVEIAG